MVEQSKWARVTLYAWGVNLVAMLFAVAFLYSGVPAGFPYFWEYIGVWLLIVALVAILPVPDDTLLDRFFRTGWGIIPMIIVITETHPGALPELAFPVFIGWMGIVAGYRVGVMSADLEDNGGFSNPYLNVLFGGWRFLAWLAVVVGFTLMYIAVFGNGFEMRILIASIGILASASLLFGLGRRRVHRGRISN